jgi:hypothetical protein
MVTSVALSPSVVEINWNLSGSKSHEGISNGFSRKQMKAPNGEVHGQEP